MTYIKSKSSGLDLFAHINSVMDTLFTLNEKLKLGLDNNVLRYCAILHDLGKAHPQFQYNMEHNNFDKVCRHEIASIFFNKIVPEDIRDIVTYVVLSHHKSIDKNEERGFEKLWENNEVVNHYVDDKWGQTVVDFLKTYYNIDTTIPTKEECEQIADEYLEGYRKIGYGYSFYRGIFMMADHLASKYDYDLERTKILEKLYKTPNVEIYNKQDERYPLSLIDIDKTKRHLICCAPCGSGKTNLGLRASCGRVFYILPFIASINAMFNRLKHDMPDELITLKHSALKSMGFEENDLSKELSDLFGQSIKICTPFQLMSICFQYKGYESIIADIKGQTVILDEIHCYKDKTQECVLEFINVLKNLDCRVIVLSATLPTILKNAILDILGEDNTQLLELAKEDIESFNRHRVNCVETFDFDTIKKRYDNGEKVLVVRNTRKLASDTFDMLSNLIPYAKMLLIHSGFERWRREDLEKTLYEYNKANEPCILISTQVVEVSLDINFDVMFTDCADIMSLIQRFGRVNRQRKAIGTIKDVFIVKNNRFTYGPYKNWTDDDTSICDNTFNVFMNIDGNVLSESKIQEMIDAVHNDISEFTLKNKDAFTPYTKDGKWKMKLYSHNVKTNISELLEFKGYIGILKRNEEKYLEKPDTSIEIPISNNNGLRPLYEDEAKGVYVIDERDYDDVHGYIR